MSWAPAVGVRGAEVTRQARLPLPVEDTDVIQVKTVPYYKLPASEHLHLLCPLTNSSSY